MKFLETQLLIRPTHQCIMFALALHRAIRCQSISVRFILHPRSICPFLPESSIDQKKKVLKHPPFTPTFSSEMETQYDDIHTLKNNSTENELPLPVELCKKRSRQSLFGFYLSFLSFAQKKQSNTTTLHHNSVSGQHNLSQSCQLWKILFNFYEEIITDIHNLAWLSIHYYILRQCGSLLPIPIDLPRKIISQHKKARECV